MNDTAPQRTRRQRKRVTETETTASAGLGAAAVNDAVVEQQSAAHDDADHTDVPRQRPAMRTPMREDSRAAADARAAEILGHLGSMDEGRDEFTIDKRQVPDGWEYEWKRKSVLGQEDPAYTVGLARTGWTEVPARRHPEMMPQDWKADTIERKGMILMERPKQISDMVRDRDNKVARNQVRVKEQQLSSAPSQDHMPRAGDPGGDSRTRPVINKGYEPMPIPDKT